MARFQRQYGVDTSMVSDGRSQAFSSLSQSLSGFSRSVNQSRAVMNSIRGQREGSMVEPSTEAPETRSNFTASGRAYNETVLKGHFAAVQNDYAQRIQVMAAQYQNEPMTFKAAAEEVKNTLLQDIAPEIRGQASYTFDHFAGQAFGKLATKQINDTLKASVLAQKEALGSVSVSAIEALKDGDDQAFANMTAVYEQQLAASDLSEAEKAESLIGYRREANLALSVGEIRAQLKSGNYAAAIDHINQVRNGDLKMVYEGTGMSPESAADYLSAQFAKHVGDYEVELKAHNTAKALEDARLHQVNEETVKTGYDLLAEGGMTLEWVRANRNILTDDQYKYFQTQAASGGSFTDAEDNPGAYIDLMDRAMTGEDVKLDAEQALRGGIISKSWYDQITKQVTDRRFGDADLIVQQTLKIDESLGDPFARARNAEALAQWNEWKANNPGVPRREAVEEARAIVRDTIIVGSRLDQSILPKPRASVLSGDKNIDVAATRAQTVAFYADRNGIPPDATDEELMNALMRDPDYLQQLELIKRWEDVQNRMAEVE